MRGEIHPEGITFPAEPAQVRLFRLALTASIGLHLAALLTSPFWQGSRHGEDAVMMVDIASVPSQDLPQIPRLPHERPISVPETPPLTVPPPPADTMPPLDKPVSPETREEIRARVAGQGLLKVLSERSPGQGGGRLASLQIPSRGSIRGVPGAAGPGSSFRDGDEPALLKSRDLGIGRQVAVAAQSPKAHASQVFRADSGLEGEIIGAVEDDQGRSSQAIVATIRQYQSGIKYAYNKELLANPAISGKITVSFLIAPDGSVKAPEIRQSSVNWPPLEEAVLKRMNHWKFPASKGAPVKVVFPFVFHPEM